MFNHTTVLLHETVDSLQLEPGSIAIDCTAGGGGHLALLLKATGPQGKVYAFDQDIDAIKHLETRFSQEIQDNRLQLIHERFSEIKNRLLSIDPSLLGRVSGIIADLGVSSHQIDTAARGFSFMADGPLDMRMNQSSNLSAATIVNNFEEQDIANILFDLGEERFARKIARNIVARREEAPIKTTAELIKIVEESVHYRTKSKKHVATKTFQALRIAVNSELEEVQQLLNDAWELLKSDGSLGIISFHSLEDRLVKRDFKMKAGKRTNDALAKLPIQSKEIPIEATIVKPFPITASSDEISANPRSRSAKLRVIKKN